MVPANFLEHASEWVLKDVAVIMFRFEMAPGYYLCSNYVDDVHAFRMRQAEQNDFGMGVGMKQADRVRPLWSLFIF